MSVEIHFIHSTPVGSVYEIVSDLVSPLVCDVTVSESRVTNYCTSVHLPREKNQTLATKICEIQTALWRPINDVFPGRSWEDTFKYNETAVVSAPMKVNFGGVYNAEFKVNTLWIPNDRSKPMKLNIEMKSAVYLKPMCSSECNVSSSDNRQVYHKFFCPDIVVNLDDVVTTSVQDLQPLISLSVLKKARDVGEIIEEALASLETDTRTATPVPIFQNKSDNGSWKN